MYYLKRKENEKKLSEPTLLDTLMSKGTHIEEEAGLQYFLEA